MTWKRYLAAVVPLALFAFDANAQKWPSRPIDMIIPFAAGGGVDVVGRSVASAFAQLGQQAGQRDGAAGTIGFNALHGALMATRSDRPDHPIANAPHMLRGVRYQVDPFDHVCRFENVFTIAVAPQSVQIRAGTDRGGARESRR